MFTDKKGTGDSSPVPKRKKGFILVSSVLKRFPRIWKKQATLYTYWQKICLLKKVDGGLNQVFLIMTVIKFLVFGVTQNGF